MNILVLLGDVTCQRPMSYGFHPDWNIQLLDLIDPEYLMLCEKYGGAKDVALSDTFTFIRRAYDRALAYLEQHANVDIVVGVGYGAQVLMNLSTSHEWTGPSIYVLSEGNTRFNFVSRPLPDEIDHSIRRGDSVWISISSLTDRRKAGRANQGRRCPHEKNALIQINLCSEQWVDKLYSTGLLKTCVDVVCKSQRSVLE